MKIRLVGAELRVAFRNFANTSIKVFCRKENKESRSFSSSDAGAGKVVVKLTDVMENISVRFSIPSVHDQSVYRFPLIRICKIAFLIFSLRACFLLRVLLPRLSWNAQNVTASLSGRRRSSSIVTNSLFS
jgi:hypothetical protein